MDIQYVESLFHPDPIYLVGGSVRDEIMGRPVNDWDFTTALTPEQIQDRLKGKHRTFLNGKKFGTIAFLVKGEKVEVTTFRAEEYAPGNRKPEVRWGSELTSDLGRRDFTINAIAKRGNRLIDPFNGRGDIQARLIRAVGCPTTRFKEDAHRMTRACRQSGVFGFTIEERTFKSIEKNAHHILDISKERWMEEFNKILLSPMPSRGLDNLAKTGLLKYMIPELALQVGYDQNSPHHTLSLWEHSLKVVDGVRGNSDDLILLWAAMLHDMGKPYCRGEKPDRSTYIKHDIVGAEMVDRLGKTLRWSNEMREAVKALVKNHMSDSANPILLEADRGGK